MNRFAGVHVPDQFRGDLNPLRGSSWIPDQVRDVLNRFALQNSLPGGISKWEPPDPIPNSEVKLLSADDSVGFPHVKVGHCQAFNKETPGPCDRVFFVWISGLMCWLIKADYSAVGYQENKSEPSSCMQEDHEYDPLRRYLEFL